MTPDEATKIDSATAGLEFLHEASSALKDVFDDGSGQLPAHVQSLIWALDYDPVGSGHPDRLARWGEFAPMIEMTDGRVYPPPLAETSDEVRTHWAEAADELSTPDVVARLHDLLWEAKVKPQPHIHAQAAVATYLDIADGHGPGSMERADYLVRALTISRHLKDGDLIPRCTERTVSAALNELSEPRGVPGAAIGLIEALTGLPQSQRPAETTALLEQAYETFNADPWLTERICDLALSMSPDADRRNELIERKVAAWENASDQDTGMRSASHLSKALEAAQKAGKTDRANNLRKKMQETSKEISLDTIATTVAIDRAEMDAYIDRFVAPDEFQGSLARFATHCPLPENRDESAAYVRTLMQDHPIQYLVSKTVLGPGNVPMQYVNGPEEHFDSAMDSHESMRIELWGQFAGDVLDRMKKKYSTNSGDVRELFASNAITEIVADEVAEAFSLYWEQRFDAALLTALPRIETALRYLSQELGLVIFVEPQAGKPGRFKGLGDLLFGLVGQFDERRRHYLYTLLANPTSYNLRNSALHGIALRGSKEQAALALHALSIFTLFEIRANELPGNE